MEVFNVIWGFRKLFLSGAKVTILLAVIMIIGGTILGSIAAAAQSVKSDKKIAKVVRAFFRGYVELFRGAPLLTLLFFGYYGLAYLGIDIDEYAACGIVLVLYAGAYICEIVRSGLESISKGQWEAGYCLGLNYLEVMIYIIFPQAFRIFLPALVGFFIAGIKDSAIVSLIGCKDIFKQASVVINKTDMALEIYAMIALFFFVVCYPLSLLVKKLEKRRIKA